MWRYANKWTILIYCMVALGPLHHSFYVGHFNWKLGKLPRLTQLDMRYQKFVAGAGYRDKFLMTPALEWQQDGNHRRHMQAIKKFCKKHRQIWGLNILNVVK